MIANQTWVACHIQCTVYCPQPRNLEILCHTIVLVFMEETAFELLIAKFQTLECFKRMNTNKSSMWGQCHSGWYIPAIALDSWYGNLFGCRGYKCTPQPSRWSVWSSVSMISTPGMSSGNSRPENQPRMLDSTHGPEVALACLVLLLSMTCRWMLPNQSHSCWKR